MNKYPAERKSNRRISHERIAELTKLGWGAQKIADELGCTKRHVQRVRGPNYLGIAQEPHERAGKAPSEERLAVAADLVAQQASIGEIQRTTGLHKNTIAKYFPEAGQNPREWMELWGQVRNDPKMRRLFDEMGGLS